ncbi:protein arginine N-methyltransferase 6 [Trichoplusia ni]|uniref:type I protein arginine methyltransferase n=1 Tax=Trichoplusia ni TaxID=7111 RepID=A0A7E5WP84_TRINI|nr:protein arginine N-methyltransferase 6 [Trichoplusia ni]
MSDNSDSDDCVDQYFTSYGDLEVHKLMLEDEPRVTIYRNAILNNKAYFRDKTVLDVGCGTGILSVFCAQAGAKKVYAVEASNIADIAKDVVKENKWEHVIEVINERVEDIKIPKVDAIVSEWMGFYLLHEGMLDSVLFARDNFLKEGGELFPESATIYVAPCSIPSLYNDWDNVQGVKMKSFAKELRLTKKGQPEILDVKPEELLGEEVAICWVNVREDTTADLNSFKLRHVVGASKNGNYQGLCVWFECNFPQLPNGTGDGRVVLDTSPKSTPTHWRQTVIVLPHEQDVEQGEPIAFELKMTRDPTSSRRYNIQLSMLSPDNIDHPLPCSCHYTKCILTKAVLAQHAEAALSEHNNKDEKKDEPIKDEILVDEPIDDDGDDDS